MQRATRRERLRYAFDNYMARGTGALIVGLFGISLLLVVGVAAIITVADQMRGVNGQDLNFLDALWYSLLRTLDPGTMGGDPGWPGSSLSMLVVTLGGIFVVGILIGIVSTGIEGKLAELRKGHSRVLESGHTVILGWSPQVFTIISELVVANANQRRACVVILADHDKVEMEEQSREPVCRHRRSTRVVCRSGNPMDLDEIDIANVQTSRAIIVLSPEGDDPDMAVIKTLLAITNNPNRRPEPYHVVAEMRDPRNLAVAQMVGKDEVELVLVGDLIARITAQTCRQSGLSVVYTELLDFGGDEIYFPTSRSLTGRTFGDAPVAFEESSVIGLLPAGGAPLLNPPMDTRIGPWRPPHRHLGGRRHGRDLRAWPRSMQRMPSHYPGRAAGPERTLVLGWNWRAAAIVRELDHYVRPGSEVTVVATSGGVEAAPQ